MKDNNYEDLKHDIKQIFSLINSLAEMNSYNKHEIKETQVGLHNALRAIYAMQSEMLTNGLIE